jgi:hypothetical protein
MRLFKWSILLRLALKRDHGHPFPGTPAHGKPSGSPHVEVRRKSRFTKMMVGMAIPQRHTDTNTAKGAVFSRTAIVIESSLGFEY